MIYLVVIWIVWVCEVVLFLWFYVLIDFVLVECWLVDDCCCLIFPVFDFGFVLIVGIVLEIVVAVCVWVFRCEF